MTTAARRLPAAPARRRRLSPLGIMLLAAGVLLAAGTVPRLRRQAGLARDASHARAAVPSVHVTSPRQVAAGSLSLPGSIDPMQQTSINARTTGYVRHLSVDIGSRVTAGQLLAEIE